MVKGQFLAHDGRTMLLFVNFDFLQIENNEDCNEALIETVNSAVTQFEDNEIDFLVSGKVPFFITAVNAH